MSSPKFYHEASALSKDWTTIPRGGHRRAWSLAWAAGTDHPALFRLARAFSSPGLSRDFQAERAFSSGLSGS